MDLKRAYEYAPGTHTERMGDGRTAVYTISREARLGSMPCVPQIYDDPAVAVLNALVLDDLATFMAVTQDPTAADKLLGAIRWLGHTEYPLVKKEKPSGAGQRPG